jgi:DNA-directed RNA polymerase specialized sigma24 family protein
LLAVARRILRDIDLAEDATQQALLRARIRRGNQIRPEAASKRP